MQLFMRAVEEAKEVHDRRQGLTPATDHQAWDFLAPDEDDDDEKSDEDQLGTGKGGRIDLRPADAKAAHARRCSAHEALAWLHLLAQDLSAVEVRFSAAEFWFMLGIDRVACAAGCCQVDMVLIPPQHACSLSMPILQRCAAQGLLLATCPLAVCFRAALCEQCCLGIELRDSVNVRHLISTHQY